VESEVTSSKKQKVSIVKADEPTLVGISVL